MLYNSKIWLLINTEVFENTQLNGFLDDIDMLKLVIEDKNTTSKSKTYFKVFIIKEMIIRRLK